MVEILPTAQKSSSAPVASTPLAAAETPPEERANIEAEVRQWRNSENADRGFESWESLTGDDLLERSPPPYVVLQVPDMFIRNATDNVGR